MNEMDNQMESIPMGELGDEVKEEEKINNILDLRFPIKIAGEEVKQLQFDFNSLTAKDLHKTSKYLKDIGIPVTYEALDFDYQLVLFSKAVKKCMKDVELADLMRLNASDASKAAGLARDFLLDKDSESEDM